MPLTFVIEIKKRFERRLI